MDKGEGRFRPLVIASKLIKFMEGLLVPKLKGYCYRKMNKSQYGFMKNVGIEECRKSFITGVQKMMSHNPSNKEKVKVLFVDFSSAYDSVNREKLY